MDTVIEAVIGLTLLFTIVYFFLQDLKHGA